MCSKLVPSGHPTRKARSGLSVRFLVGIPLGTVLSDSSVDVPSGISTRNAAKGREMCIPSGDPTRNAPEGHRIRMDSSFS